MKGILLMELRNRNTLTLNWILLSIVSFIVFAALLGSFEYSSIASIFDSFSAFSHFGDMFTGGSVSKFSGILTIISFCLIVVGLILIALLKRKVKTKLSGIVVLIIFSTLTLWTALTAYNAKDEINQFLNNWQSTNFSGVVITSFYLMEIFFVLFFCFSLLSLYFILFTKQMEKEKTIEEIVEVEEVVDEPQERIVEKELFPEEKVEEPQIPEEKVIEKKVDSLKTSKMESNKNVKVISDDEEAIAKVNSPAKEISEPTKSKKIDKKVEVKPSLVKPEKTSSKRMTFQERLDASDQELKKIYREIKEYIESYGVKSRISKTGDSYRLHTVRYLKITVAGKKLKLYFNLNPNDYKDSTIPFQDVSDKKVYEDVPFAFKVRSPLSIKRAKSLIDDMMEKVETE